MTYIWVVRDPRGRVIGASGRSGEAAIDDCGSIPAQVFAELLMDTRNDSSGTYESRGYTLTRTPPVTLLEEWRVLDMNGESIHADIDTYNDSDERSAAKYATWLDYRYPTVAPHRAVQLAYVEVTP